MADAFQCDILIVGGGLAGGLAALALAARRPDLAVRLVEPDAIGGNHVWSFFEADVAAEHRPLLDPLIDHAWPAYDVAFPGFRRRIDQPYFSIPSERLDAAVRAALPADRLHLGQAVISLSPTDAVLADGSRITAGAVIDARGPGDVALLDAGWQKFVGLELELAAPHGLERPVVMDATVPQIDGYRFVYCLPFAPDRLFVEDTYYSNAPDLDHDAVEDRIAAFAMARGWQVRAVPRREAGVLAVTMGGDFDAYWASTGSGIAKLGTRAGLFHPTTGYSLPDAVRTAHLVTGAQDLSAPALHRLLHDHAAKAWEERGFYRMLDRMLFRAAEPGQRYKVLERFYRLDPGLIARFYAARSTALDKLRILSGRPPVPVGRALGALRERAA